MTMRVNRIDTGALRELANGLAVTRQEQKVADRILGTARGLAPVRTGTLRRSLTVERVRDPMTGQTEFRVGWDTDVAEYGPLVEFGTEDTSAQPHLRPAAIKVKGL